MGPHPKRPLAGIRIVDLTVVAAGPVATSLLADLGAEVIKIEPTTGRGAPYSPDGLLTPHVPGTPDRPYNRAPAFNEFNRGKQSVLLNVTQPSGMEALKRLTAISDALVENFSPRVMENWGLTWPVLRKIQPDLVYVSLSGFGATGLYKHRPAFAPTIDATSGMEFLTGYDDSGPIKPGYMFSDFNAALHGAYAVMTALFARRRQGKGQWVELAMRELGTLMTAEALLDFLANGRLPQRTGNQHPWKAPQGVYPCRGEDQWVALTVSTDEQWRTLCRLMGREHLAEDQRFALAHDRWRHRAEIDPLIAAWTRERAPAEVMHLLQQHGIAAGAVLDAPSLLADPHFCARGVFRRVPHPETGEDLYRHQGWRLSRCSIAPEKPAPRYGEHTRSVIEGLLGMDIDAMIGQGATRLEPP